MSDTEDDKLPVITFCEDDGRGKVKKAQIESKFRPCDNVRFRDAQKNEQEGRCKVTSVPTTGKCTLENQNGKPVNGGASIKEEELIMD
ncbi:hypothetical protein F5882DRAFT_408407 [Hyaloscypha sp. PMI_1271]|nr:hypothetical protein F5882DRAFT_408407 [Hyaloscypha sp. PMI_1271]